MKIAICHTKNGIDADEVYKAWEHAAKLHGDIATHYYSLEDFKKSDADVAVMISYPNFIRPSRLIDEYELLQKEQPNNNIKLNNPINTFRIEVLKICYNKNIRPIFIDSGILKCDRERTGNKNNHYQVGYDCIKGLGEYYNDNMPDDRFKKLNIELKPWRQITKNCLLFGQIPFGVGSQHIDIKSWYRYCLYFLKENNISIYYHEHPNVAIPFHHDKYKIKVIESKDKTIEKIGFTLTFSSNAAVDAIVNGIPSIAMSKLSSAYKVCTNDFKEYENIKLFDRERWLSDLAYTQWNINEMESGECWDHLRQHSQKPINKKYPLC